ncbi:hypothetical protein HELRODRAFT_166531 [Helobdella robusta]|uniref:Uncharacterized protein n=1 Tax=Helobdella robusta TaxID=6412 RepID=T1EY77_HELRO|nr:hypothetical protein HELRODRAFT_166531 [Helobdella robusta]ESO11530.1 hypothetical protein HELRODRAFT_166531 [Helobdella robusta]
MSAGSILVKHFHDVYAELSRDGRLSLFDDDLSLRPRKTIQASSRAKNKIRLSSDYSEKLLLPVCTIMSGKIKTKWFLCYNQIEKKSVKCLLFEICYSDCVMAKKFFDRTATSQENDLEQKRLRSLYSRKPNYNDNDAAAADF